MFDVEAVGLKLGKEVQRRARGIAAYRGFTWEGQKDCEVLTLEDIRNEIHRARQMGKFRVSSDNCGNSLYGSAEANMAFRFWHDMLHDQYNLRTTLVDELQLGMVHSAAFQGDERILMWIDTCGQSLYNFITGEFPKDQLAFAQRVLRRECWGGDFERSVRHIALETLNDHSCTQAN